MVGKKICDTTLFWGNIFIGGTKVLRLFIYLKNGGKQSCVGSGTQHVLEQTQINLFTNLSQFYHTKMGFQDSNFTNGV